MRKDRVDMVATNANQKLIQDRQMRRTPRKFQAVIKHQFDKAKSLKLKEKIVEIERNRKQRLLKGNGKILSFYDPVNGTASNYQYEFRSQPDTAQVENVNKGFFSSSIMTVTPDP